MNSNEALDQLAQQAQELNMGYEDVKEGEYQFQANQVKLFKNLSAASDFILSFGIRNYQITDGTTQSGEYAVQVNYQRVQ